MRENYPINPNINRRNFSIVRHIHRPKVREVVVECPHFQYRDACIILIESHSSASVALLGRAQLAWKTQSCRNWLYCRPAVVVLGFISVIICRRGMSRFSSDLVIEIFRGILATTKLFRYHKPIEWCSYKRCMLDKFQLLLCDIDIWIMTLIVCLHLSSNVLLVAWWVNLLHDKPIFVWMANGRTKMTGFNEPY